MIKKLKIKFIALAMVSMFVLLTLIIVTVNIVNYNYVISDTDKVLEIFLHESNFDDDGPKDKENPPDSKRPKGEKEKSGKSKLPDTFMLDEYYSVLISKDGKVADTDRDHIPWLSEENAAKYALLAYEEGTEKGSVSIFRYHTDSEGENTLITLMNIDRELSACRKFLFISLFVGICGYIAVSVAIIFYAYRFTKPIAESYIRQKCFITNAGHELKTPLTIINANAELIEMDIGDNESLNEIKNQANRLTEMTNNLVYLSRMEEAEGKLPMTEFPISDIINEALSAFKGAAAAQDKRLETDIKPCISYMGNSHAIEQLVSILMENAIKYSSDDESIISTLYKQGKQIVFTVSNTTCVPLQNEDTSLLFERFYRSEVSRNSETGGHGIGLSMAKAIVDAHNGRINVCIEEGNRFKITVTLPTK